ncbi:MAG: bifunctional NAD(P)H-hydrate repair enzyme [Thermonema sp.]|uniref:NAD(P)H-hydrate dehydratase n=1 Tax=Thermonema sp. TaxID=2231181 RepID=UPI0021DE5CB9|nr:NAD(P)H-hydrate dehydratase [Thermonema sp.]GIV39664.1 MAG: bifunctional NAD(P)H-hydrate repair enzyme [Thermonema sp.]
MKLLPLVSTEQIRAWDHATIHGQGVPSLQLMEHAALAFVHAFQKRVKAKQAEVWIFAGMGNNGGDGLAIARLLRQRGYDVRVWVLKTKERGSADFETNLARWRRMQAVNFIHSEADFPAIPSGVVVIDALFGTGLSRPLEGLPAALVRHLNAHAPQIVAVDMPSGLLAQQLPQSDSVVRAQLTITFQVPKLCFVLQDFAPYLGAWEVVDIGLTAAYYPLLLADTHEYLLTEDWAKQTYRPRSRFAHKGTYGHALLWCGSKGKIGAAILSAKACLRAGAGLLTVHTPACGYVPLQTAVPEAMTSIDEQNDYLTSFPAMKPYSAIGAGPGIGQHEETRHALQELLVRASCPLVLDADALNLIAAHPELKKCIPKNSILTPHPKEFERLLGYKWQNDFDLLDALRTFARQYEVYVVLKRAYSVIACPDGQLFFNTAGNAGLAKGGSGDVLTGVITALLAQGYEPKAAACLGVYWHAAAADVAAMQRARTSLLPTDVVEAIGSVFKTID